MRSAAVYLTSVLAAAVALPGAASATEVDLELVLAVDVSPSMDIDELHVQREGYVAAFRHPDVLAAIGSGPLGGIAVTYVEWSGPQSQVTVVPWTLINSEEAAQAFAAQLLASTPNRYRGTSISGGLLFAAATFANDEFTSARQVIDISGDGPNNRGVLVEPVRSGIVGAGVTINGLPLVVKAPIGPYSIPNLDVYYEDCVIGGPRGISHSRTRHVSTRSCHQAQTPTGNRRLAATSPEGKRNEARTPHRLSDRPKADRTMVGEMTLLQL